MKKFWYCFLKDFRLSVKSFYFFMEIGMALIFVAVLVFAVSETSSGDQKIYAVIESEEIASQEAINVIKEQLPGLEILDTRESIAASLEENRNAVGLVLFTKDSRSVFEFILQGYEDQKQRNILKTTIEAGIASILSGEESEIEVITLGKSLDRLNNRTNLLPIFLTLNSAFMGLFIIASYIFLDKEEGTIKAFAVTPASVWQYLLSKLFVMMITGIATSFITVALVAGKNVNYPVFFIALIVYNGFGSALGLFIASFFNTIQKAMGWLYSSVILLGFASVSYFVPSFSPLLIRILPSYPMLFSFREILLSDGNIGYVFSSIVGFFGAAVLLFYFANYRFKKTLTV